MSRIALSLSTGLCAALSLFGCSSSDSMGAPASNAGVKDASTAVDFVAQASDFECMLDWTKVREFYITNKAGKMDETLAVANSESGGTYPPGTIIQLFPLEAMVKRKVGFSAETKDWEFFSLNPTATGTEILARGTTMVLNQFKLNCLDCHKKADPKFDMVCERTHGCDPLPFTEMQIQSAQAADPRCHD